MVPRANIVSTHEPLHFKPCTLGMDSKCDDCLDVIKANDERHVAFVFYPQTKAIKTVVVRCGTCMKMADSDKQISRDMEDAYFAEQATCATPRKRESSSAGLYVQAPSAREIPA